MELDVICELLYIYRKIMFDNGVIHDILWNDLLEKVIHMELRCVPCSVQKDGVCTETKKWLTKQYIREILELVSISVNKRVVGVSDNDDEAQSNLLAKSPPGLQVEVLESDNVRVACVFRSDFWATDRQKLAVIPPEGKKIQKQWLPGEKVVVSAALLSFGAEQFKIDDLNQTLFRAVGASQNTPDTTNTISKYFLPC